MPTAVQDLMSSPPVTCPAEHLPGRGDHPDARPPHRLGGGDRRADRWSASSPSATCCGRGRRAADPGREPVRRWMTADPDVLGPRRGGRRGLVGPHPPPLPAPAGRRRRPTWSGVVSLRDLLTVAQIRPADEAGGRGAARARRAWWWPRPRSATCGAGRASTTTASTRPSSWPPDRSLEDVWHLLVRRRPPRPGRRRPASPPRWPACGPFPPGSPRCSRGSLAARGAAARRPAHRGLAPRERARLAHRRHDIGPAGAAVRGPAVSARSSRPC